MKPSTFLALMVIVACIAIGLATGCHNRGDKAYAKYLKDKEFQNCIDKCPSDYVCDSCWIAIYKTSNN